MATKNDIVKEILDIEEVDTKSNLNKKNKEELEAILKELKNDNEVKGEESSQEEVVEVSETIDKEALMAQLKAEMMQELKEQAIKEAKAELAKSEDTEDDEETVESLSADKPIRKKEIDRFEPIPVMNVTNGKLIYASRKTGAEWVWGNYGDVEYIEFQELLTMRSGSRRFLDEPFLLIMDEDAVNYLGLTRKYKEMINIESLDSVFDMSYKEFIDVVEQSPRGIKYAIVTRARQKFEEGTLDSMKKVNFLNDRFKTDIGQRG